MRAGRRAGALAVLAAGAATLWAACGVGFANYDTLYALAWGGQIARGENPAYGVPIAPTPHPLAEALGVVLSPLSAHAIEELAVGVGFISLAGCGWLLYRLGATWFNAAAGALAAVIFLTRTPVLSYGVRAYIDLPYLALVLAALLAIARRPRAGGAPLGLLALAGLLRPEAWAFSALYWLYLSWPWLEPRLGARARALGASSRALAARLGAGAERAEGELGRCGPATAGVPDGRRVLVYAALVALAPAIWLGSDLAVTGNALWSLTNTRHTASRLDRVTGIANVPEYIPRRLGEILRIPALVGALAGIVMGLRWARTRTLPAVAVTVLALVVFAAFATVGLPINSRYAFGAAAMLAILCGAGVFGFLSLPAGRERRVWGLVGATVLVALLAFAPSSFSGASRELRKLKLEHRFEGELVALVHRGAITLRCGPVGVPNHAPIPLLALYMKTSPSHIVSPETGHIESGVYVKAARREVEVDYVLDPHDPHERALVPPGFAAVGGNHSWRLYERCGS